MLTFGERFESAHLRTPDEQSRIHTLAPSLESLLQAPFEVRIRDAQTGAFALADATDPLTGLQRGVMIVRDVLPDPEEDTNIEHVPDTEVLSGDEGPYFQGEEL